MYHHQRPSGELAAAAQDTRSSLLPDWRGAKPTRDGGWLESSWDLSRGLEISDFEGELPEEFGGHRPIGKG